jgi:hypothetical protein
VGLPRKGVFTAFTAKAETYWRAMVPGSLLCGVFVDALDDAYSDRVSA